MNLVDYNNSIKNVCVYIFFSLFLMIALIFFPHQKNPIQFSMYKLITLAIILYAFYALANTSYSLVKNERDGILEVPEMKKTIVYNMILGLFMILAVYNFAIY